MDLKFGLKIGHIELQFEGSASTFEAKFESVFKELVEFGKDKFGTNAIGQSEVSGISKATKAASPMTVKAIAAKLGVDGGGELLYATLASLAVVKGKETFSRQEINDEMKLGYYKSSYSSNLTNYMDTLAKQGTIIETSKDIYTVKENSKIEMEQKLAQ